MKIDVLGVQINADSRNTIIFLIKKLLADGRKIFIATPYSEMIVRAQEDRGFREILNAATFALPDGTGVLWAAHYLKFKKFIPSLFSIIFRPSSIRDPIPEKISGSDFIWDLASLASEKNYSIFLLGGFGNTPELVAKRLKEKYPNLKIVGTFNEKQDLSSSGLTRGSRLDSGSMAGMTERARQKINESNADFLFVALGPVVQEKWIASNLPNLRVKLAIGLGGTFDYLASKVSPAPQIWAKIGLEWLWRLVTQPWRAFRVSKGVLGLIWYTIKK